MPTGRVLVKQRPRASGKQKSTCSVAIPNSAQTTLLGRMFALRATPTCEDVGRLSEETGLNKKSISEWFARKRRSVDEKGLDPAHPSSAYTPSITISQTSDDLSYIFSAKMHGKFNSVSEARPSASITSGGIRSPARHRNDTQKSLACNHDAIVGSCPVCFEEIYFSLPSPETLRNAQLYSQMDDDDFSDRPVTPTPMTPPQRFSAAFKTLSNPNVPLFSYRSPTMGYIPSAFPSDSLYAPDRLKTSLDLLGLGFPELDLSAPTNVCCQDMDDLVLALPPLESSNSLSSFSDSDIVESRSTLVSM